MLARDLGVVREALAELKYLGFDLGDVDTRSTVPRSSELFERIALLLAENEPTSVTRLGDPPMRAAPSVACDNAAEEQAPFRFFVVREPALH